jgi:leucyl aminopeptidase
MRGAGGKVFQQVRDLGLKRVVVPDELAEVKGFTRFELLEAFLTGGSLGSYRFRELKTGDQAKDKAPNECVVLAKKKEVLPQVRAVLSRVRTIVHAVCLARDLVTLPANRKTPTMLAIKAQAVARENALRCKVISEAQAKKLGMGAFLAVAQGSREPAAMIVLEYRPDPDCGPPIVLVGKGITFDSGGISLKSPDKMERMKDDMAGGAVVLGVLQASAQMKLPVNLVGIVPATENLPDGKAYKPGDVITSMSGQTIEVISTDAEGRLILADALTYAQRYRPQAVLDLATLTGACVTALGNNVAGIMGNSDRLLTSLRAASVATGEKVWPFPLWEEYFDDLKSDVADFKNVGERAAGTIIGGMFLSKFVGDTPWVHLDIAGPVWSEKDRPYIPKGASGYGVRLLLQLLEDWPRETGGRRSRCVLI